MECEVKEVANTQQHAKGLCLPVTTASSAPTAHVMPIHCLTPA